MTLADLQTPCLLIERTRLLDNVERMRRRLAELGVALRPHVKTAKAVEIARLAHGGAPGPITVSTLKEAEHFAAHGFNDILYAVAIVPSKLDRALRLRERGVALKLVTDHPEVARALAERAARESSDIEVWIEIDTGDGRSGIAPDDPLLLDLARLLHAAPRVTLGGVMTHAGQSYECRGAVAVREVARVERDGIVRAAQRLRGAGLPCPAVSAGSTPTAVHAEDLEGVTEMRPGAYVFFDLSQCAIGSCERGQIALTVSATVIGHRRDQGLLLIDAGALALSKDRGAGDSRSYGELCQPHDGLRVTQVAQEHGFVPVDGAAWFDRLPVGARVRVLPNHACLTAAGHDRYHVVEGDRVVDEWPRINYW